MNFGYLDFCGNNVLWPSWYIVEILSTIKGNNVNEYLLKPSMFIKIKITGCFVAGSSKQKYDGTHENRKQRNLTKESCCDMFTLPCKLSGFRTTPRVTRCWVRRLKGGRKIHDTERKSVSRVLF